MARPKRTADTPLPPRQQQFIAEYLIDRNGKAAAIRAGYSPRGKDSRGAQVIASRLLDKPEIAAAIAKAMQEKTDKAGVTTERVLAGLLREAEWRGEGSTHSARVAALRALGEYLALFVTKVEHDHRGEIVMALTKMTPEERLADAQMLAQKAIKLIATDVT
jgi:phage terminase small subunit